MFHRESTDSSIIGMIAEVVEETKYGKDDSIVKATGNKPTKWRDDDRALITMTWEELEKASMRPHKPQRNIGTSVSLKDRMNAFNASCTSMGGAMEDFEASMSSLNAMIPDVQAKNQLTSDNGTSTSTTQLKTTKMTKLSIKSTLRKFPTRKLTKKRKTNRYWKRVTNRANFLCRGTESPGERPAPRCP
jgi:hypothetical protein